MTSAELPPSQPQKHQNSLEQLGLNSYTAQRLQNATPEHLHLTTRRCFIGPIPEGWLKSHRRDWYKHHLHIHYSSRAVTFSANPDVGRHRRMTGIDGPSATATYGQSFPQPEDLDDDGEDAEDRNPEAEATTDEPPAISAPRSRSNDEEEFESGEDDDNNKGEEDETRVAKTNQGSGRGTLDPATENSGTVSKHRDKSKVPGKSALKRPKLDPDSRKRSQATSFVTANEDVEPSEPFSRAGEAGSQVNGGDQSLRTSDDRQQSVTGTDPSSTQSLLRRHNSQKEGNVDGTLDQESNESQPSKPQPRGILQRIRSKSAMEDDRSTKNVSGDDDRPDSGRQTSSGVQFNLPDLQADKLVKQRLVQMGKRRTARMIRRSKLHDGEIIKMEKMLVRVEFTSYDIPENFAENDSQKIETRITDKWKEYMVVCRETEDDDMEFMLQLYKTRVIPAIDKAHIKKASTHMIPLTRKSTRVNLYSSLDKTMVIWKRWKKGTLIYVMRPRSGSSSMEWYTFLRNILGWSRPTLLQVNVPDLDVSVRLDNPFKSIEGARDLAQAADGDEEALLRTMKEEQAAATNIIARCMSMLNRSSEWKDLVEPWADQDNVGLAWKRYDRLEWVHGANEKRMYGTMAMEQSHDLELRPKQHYPTSVSVKDKKSLTEPPPVEGFLVRLTSQRGVDKKIGKLFFKRLYFSSHNQFLLFNRPAHADPPPPPKFPMRKDSKLPSSHQIAEKIPLIYEINPFPLRKGQVEWLAYKKGRSQENMMTHDNDAEDESDRMINLVLKCDGAFNLCDVRIVRDVHRGTEPADEALEEGPDADFNQDVSDTVQDDGSTGNFDEERTFEMVLYNGLVIRLQAFNKVTKAEWVRRLRALVSYWRHRTASDSILQKAVRAENLHVLNIDEEQEAHLGQTAQKWEVTKSRASPVLHNICGLSACRPLHISGMLYRKTRTHAGFERCLVFLSRGRLVVFKDALRSRSGAVVASIQHDRIGVLDLKDCYVYSGLLTGADLGGSAAASSAMKGGRPGRTALPRYFEEDGWSSVDEDAMTCFVVWHGKRRGWFRSSEASTVENDDKKRQREGPLLARTNSSFLGTGGASKVRLVSRLGVTGKSIVFKARSRAERDRWVMGVGMEIERMGGGEDVRIVGEGKK